MKKLALVTPGEILLEEWLKPMGVSQYRLAIEIGVPPRCINEIVHGKRAITADTALRLARFSEQMRRPGSTCNRITTWKKPNSKLERHWKISFPGLSGQLPYPPVG